jgi:hypothetical protein
VAKMIPPSEGMLTNPEEKEVGALITRAAKGDQSALPALRELMKIPEVVDLLGGDLARTAQVTLIDNVSGKNLLLKESLTHKLDLLRTELAGPNPAPVERLLVENVVACWLHLSCLEQRYAQNESLRTELGLYYQRCIDHAHKRYLSAIKTLATVRKLALPAVQVNIGQNQVNLASTGASDSTAAHAHDGLPAE